MYRDRQLGKQIKETNALSAQSLLFGILASVVSAAIIPLLGGGRPGLIAGAGLSPVLAALFTTQGRGLARSAGIAALCAIALLASVGSFTVPELISGRGTLLGSGAGTFVDTERPAQVKPTEPSPTPSTTKATTHPTHRPSTPPPPPTSTSTPPSPKVRVEMPTAVRCPEVAVGAEASCGRIGVSNKGTATIRIDSANPEGDQASDFIVTKACHGTLRPDRGCSVRLVFRPTEAGDRQAVVRVGLGPGVTKRVTITGTAAATDTDGGDDGSDGDGQDPTVTPPPVTETPGETPADPSGQ